jgi:hypothetical protein
LRPARCRSCTLECTRKLIGRSSNRRHLPITSL